MLVGVQAFRGVSRVEILSRILEEDPPELFKVDPKTPPGLMRVVARCLEKEPRDRFESIRDVGFALNAQMQSSEESRAVSGPRLRRRSWRWAAAAAVLAAVGAAYWLGGRLQAAHTSSPHFRQLTYRGTGIFSARFAPDGQTIVFSSESSGRPPELFTMRLDGPEVRPLGLPPAHILSISSTGQMAVLLLKSFALFPRIGHIGGEQGTFDPFLLTGTLAEASLAGGAPRELLEDVLWADWAPGTADLAVVRRFGNGNRVEDPIGKVIASEELFLNYLRVSPGGDRVAFKDWISLFLAGGGRRPAASGGRRCRNRLVQGHRGNLVRLFRFRLYSDSGDHAGGPRAARRDTTRGLHAL